MADGVVWEQSGLVLEDGSGNVIDDCPDCPCDTATTPCNPTPIPRELTLVVTYRCTQFAVTLHYNPTIVAGGPGWSYIDTGSPGDVLLCTGFYFRDFTIWCVSGVWNAELVYVEGTTQQNANLATPTLVSTGPLCLTIVSDPFSHCGGGNLYFAIGPGCTVVPTCCNWGSLSSTATATYTIGSLAAATRNLTKNASDTGYGDSGFACDVGDGTFILLIFNVLCDPDDTCTWTIQIQMHHFHPTLGFLKTMEWQIAGIRPGTVRSDGTFFVCSPFHAHMSITNTSGPASSSTVMCGGKAYPFGPAGTISATLDVVTP